MCAVLLQCTLLYWSAPSLFFFSVFPSLSLVCGYPVTGVLVGSAIMRAHCPHPHALPPSSPLFLAHLSSHNLQCAIFTIIYKLKPEIWSPHCIVQPWIVNVQCVFCRGSSGVLVVHNTKITQISLVSTTERISVEASGHVYVYLNYLFRRVCHCEVYANYCII